MSVWHYCCVCGHFLMTKDAFELFRLWTNGNSLLVRQCIIWFSFAPTYAACERGAYTTRPSNNRCYSWCGKPHLKTVCVCVSNVWRRALECRFAARCTLATEHQSVHICWRHWHPNGTWVSRRSDVGGCHLQLYMGSMNTERGNRLKSWYRSGFPSHLKFWWFRISWNYMLWWVTFF